MRRLRKDPEPRPRGARARVLAGQRVGHFHPAFGVGLIAFPKHMRARQLRMQGRLQALRQHQNAVFAALALAHDHRAVGEIDIFHAQLQPFGNAHARAVEQLGQEQVRSLQCFEDARQLFLRQHHRQAPLHAWPAHIAQPGQVDLQHLGIEKNQRRQRLSVRGRGHRAFGRQPAEKAFDLGPAHLRRVTYAVEAHEGAYPVHIGLFGAAAVVQQANALAHLIEQPGRLQCREALRRRLGSHSSAPRGKRHAHHGLPVAAQPPHRLPPRSPQGTFQVIREVPLLPAK